MTATFQLACLTTICISTLSYVPPPPPPQPTRCNDWPKLHQYRQSLFCFAKITDTWKFVLVSYQLGLCGVYINSSLMDVALEVVHIHTIIGWELRWSKVTSWSLHYNDGIVNH